MSIKENKKIAKKKARGSISKNKNDKHELKIAQKEEATFKKETIKYIDRNRRRQEQTLKKERILKSKYDLKKIKLAKSKNEEGLKKAELWYNKKINNSEIKEVIKLNKSPKGKRLIQHADKDNLIELRHVRKAYTTESLVSDALIDINLEIKKGEFVVVLGPSGSGKTTLLNTLSGLDRATEGDVIIDGVNISSLTEKELTLFRRNNIGFVFQSYNLLSTLNVYDNVEIGRSLQKDKTQRLNIDEILKNIGLLDKKESKTHELSGGQQQRVSIARAISKNPKILIGDEPTGALDSKSRLDVFKVFKNINQKYKTTIIIVTHNKDIAGIADKVIYVEDSKIAKVVQNSNPKPIDSLK